MVVYTLEQCFSKRVCDRLTEDFRFGQKNHLFRWSSFWSWRVCKQQNCRIWGTENPHAYIEKLTHPKRGTVWCGFCSRIIIGHFSSKMSKKRPLLSMAIVIRPCWTNFCSQKLKWRILATFDFNRTPLSATQPKLHSIFCALFLKIVWLPRSCDMTPLDYYLRAVVKDKCYADKPETIDALKDNIREVIGEIQLHTIDNVLKNWTDRVGYCMASRSRER